MNGNGERDTMMSMKPFYARPFHWLADRLREGSPDQPRDDHGRFASTGTAASAAAKELLKPNSSGGASFNIFGQRPKNGFMVAQEKPEIQMDVKLSVPEVEKTVDGFINDHMAELESGEKYVGLWLNRTDHKLDLNISIKHADRATSIRFGRDHKQLMGYDVIAGKEYNILKDGSRPSGPDDKGELNEAAKPARDGTQFFIHPHASKADIKALATAIVAQAAQDRKDNGEV